MKMSKIFFLMAITVLFFSCGASKQVKEPNAKLDQMMEESVFEVNIRSAEPQLTQAMAQVANSGILAPGNSMSRIDVTGSGYFIKMKGDSVSADLPYYGERQMGGGYNSDAGIKFDGVPKNLEIVKNDIKQSYLLKFSVDANAEDYFVAVVVGNNLTSTIDIRSSHRNRIRYTGTATQVERK